MKGTLALLVPAYNAAGFLPRLLKSAAGQTRHFDEIWVYDDCSSDDTAAVARKYGAQVVIGATNRGCSAGKNALSAHTKCEWIHFHDADDELSLDFVERAKRWIDRDAYDVVVFGSVEREEATGAFIAESVHDCVELSADPIRYTIATKISANAGIYRRSAFLDAGGFDIDPDVLYNEDVAMHCSLARAGLRFAADPAVVMTNWRRAGSMSVGNPTKCFRAHYHVMLKALKHDNRGAYSREISERLWDNAASAASFLEWETADASAGLAYRLAGAPRLQSPVFRILCRLGPSFALRVREWLIRSLKPRFRVDYPGWRLR